ncbi:MAG: IS1634 family transposase [Anaerolineales bacterium]|nr:IS1634 family transposase [Anaerolineales bacterium]
MFIKLTRSGPRRYVQLVESYRDESGRTKQRTVASLGRLESLEPHLESLVRGLERVTGRQLTRARSPAAQASPAIEFAPTRTLGDVWALTELWRELGFEQLGKLCRSQRQRIDIEPLIRIMVFNRLCDPDSKLGVLRWLETVCLPGVSSQGVTHQQLLRAMDGLNAHREALDELLASLLRPLIDQTLSVVFYDLTTISTEGLSEQADEVRRYGKSKSGGIRRQFMLGVVQTADGLPLYHEVFQGNVAEGSTLRASLDKVLERYPIERVIAVADRGLMSLDNLAELQAMVTPSGKPLEFILAVPGRRYPAFAALLSTFHQDQCQGASEEVIGELSWQGLRLVVAHDPYAAAQRTGARNEAIATLEAQAREWVEKLEGQDDGQRYRGRKLSDGGARARFYHEVLEAKLGHIIRVDLKSELFNYTIDADARALAELMDGKLLLVTNTPALSPAEVVSRYKALADIERGFRVLKSQLELGPVYHRLAERIRAHACICFIALILYRVMRQRLRAANSGYSPERALASLERVQHHRIKLNAHEHTGISTITPEQAGLFKSLKVSKPTTTATQLQLL